MKKSITILSFLFAFLLCTPSAEASFPVKKNKENKELVAKSSVDKDDASATVAYSGKSQIAALLLCWFVGIIGIHRFYLGYTWQGVVQLLTLGGLGIWTLIDFIRIIIGDLQPKNGSYTSTF